MVPLPGKTQAAYNNLITALENASDKSNCFVKSGSRPINAWFSDIDSEYVTLSGRLHLDGWQEHDSPQGTPKRLSILVQVQETIRKSPLALTRSTVWVSYYRIENGGARLLLTVRFEYDSAPNKHPVFHAQVSDEQISFQGGVGEDLGFTYGVVQSNPVSMRNARIPTCDMTLPSVLLCLAADHLNTESFSDFRAAVLRSLEAMPHPNVSRLMDSISGETNHLCSIHWFAHVA